MLHYVWRYAVCFSILCFSLQIKQSRGNRKERRDTFSIGLKNKALANINGFIINNDNVPNIYESLETLASDGFNGKTRGNKVFKILDFSKHTRNTISKPVDHRGILIFTPEEVDVDLKTEIKSIDKNKNGSPETVVLTFPFNGNVKDLLLDTQEVSAEVDLYAIEDGGKSKHGSKEDIIENNFKSKNKQYATLSAVKSRNNHKKVPQKVKSKIFQNITEHKSGKSIVDINDEPVQNGKSYASENVWSYFNDKRNTDDHSRDTNDEANKRSVNKYVLVLEGDREYSNSESEQDDSQEDVQKTNVLRDAYGDACLKLVVRKCFKACKSALKEVCNMAKCKSKLKSTFKRNAKGECKSAFGLGKRSNGKNDTKSKNKNVSKLCKDSEDCSDDSDENLRSMDIIRSDYIGGYCLSEATYKGEETKETTTLSPLRLNDEHAIQINVLRDRYEKACKKASVGRCSKACTTVFIKSCSKEECKKRVKKNYKRACKRHCKYGYNYKSKGGSKSSSSSRSSDSD